MANDDSVSRRDWLKKVGVASAVVAFNSHACADEGGGGGAANGDGDLDSGIDAGDPAAVDSGADAVGGDASDAAADLGSDLGDARVDGGIAPAPALEPLRGDGTHPFHYIDTIVIVQMENRSFDHYFGALSLVEGRSDVDGLLPTTANPRSTGGLVMPAKLEDSWIIDPDPGHGHNASLRQWNEGANDGFVRDWERELSPEELEEKLGWVMGYHTREQLPAAYGLADAFTLCDRWFCSLLGPTWPNRFYSHAASSGGMWSNGVALEAPTPYPRLVDAGFTLGTYHQSIVHFLITLNDVQERHYTRKRIEDFFVDAADGTLPNVTLVEPDYGINDDHPPVDPRLGQAFIGGVYEALRKSPQWDRCLFLVFYDEHGGFHDHVAPPLAAGEERAADGFAQLGFRVPAIIAGGLAKRGHVLHDVIEHSSVPALISNVFGLEHVNERSRLAGNIGAALDRELTLDAARPSPPQLPGFDISFDRFIAGVDLPFGQPELLEFWRRRFGTGLGTRSEQIRDLERYARALNDLGNVRVR